MARTPLDHLLSYQLYEQGQHPNPKYSTWEKFVYDEEVLHYGLLSMFLKASPGFAKDFLRLGRRRRVHTVLPPYRGHPFDLEIRTDSQVYYAEVNTRSRLFSTPGFLSRVAGLASSDSRSTAKFSILRTRASTRLAMIGARSAISSTISQTSFRVSCLISRCRQRGSTSELMIRSSSFQLRLCRLA